jgi:hypothetical protein
MSTTITPTEQNIDINVTNDVIDINVTNEIVDVNATTQQIDINVAGAYPLPSSVFSVFGRVGDVVATEGDYTLTQLGDVTLTSPSNGQVLKYNGTAWVNGTDAGGITSIATTSPITGGTITSTGTIGITQATTSTDGYLSSTDWNTFNNKQGALTLTTTGTSGAATLVGTTLNIPQYTEQFVGTVTSVAASITGNSIGITGSPITSSGTLAFAFAGNATQYVRGDGALATLPTNGGGGGASVSYYLNGSINQGTIGGVTYYEMNKTPIIGAGTDFTRSSNGYIASFLTDANDPALLNIPAGNFNFETYFQASSGGGSPTFYIELYKYDGTTFTLIASNSGSPKLINDGANIEAYFSALAVPQTTLTLTDRLAIRIYVNTSGRTITLHTENGHLCQVITTFTTGLTALNGLTAQVQYLATGTSGTDFNIASATATHTFNLPTASATNRGALSSADWTTFNSKQNALTNPITGTGTSGQVAYFNGTNSITSNAAFAFTPTSQLLVNNSVTAASAIARGTFINPTLIASANNDVLVALDISATFNTAPYTGVTSLRFRASNFTIDNNGRTYLGDLAGTYSSLDAGFAVTARSGSTTPAIVVRSNAAGNGTSNPMQVWQNTSATNLVSVLNNGNLLLNTTTDAGFRLDVNGTARTQQLHTFLLGTLLDSTSASNFYSVNTGGSTYGGLALRNQTQDYTGYIQTGRSGNANGINFFHTTFAGATTGDGHQKFSSTAVVFGSLSKPQTLTIYKVGGSAGTAQYPLVLNNQTNTTNTGVGLIFQTGNETGGGPIDSANITAYKTNLGGGFVTSNLRFFTISDGANTLSEKMRISDASNLLIGTTTDLLARLQVSGSITASSAIARGGLINTTLVASANNDVLVGLDINPTFTNGAFTGVSNFGLRVNGRIVNTLGNNQVIFSSVSATTGWQVLTLQNTGANCTFGIEQSTGTALFGNSLAYATVLGTSNATALQFGTNALTRQTIFSNGNIGINTTTDAGFRLDVNGTARVQGNTTISLNQNAETICAVQNTTSGTGAGSKFRLISDGGFEASIAKFSSAFTPYKTIGANDFVIYNTGAGNMTLLNDRVLQNINFATGGASTAQATLFSTGNFAIGTSTDVASSILTINSTTKGFLPPRMTTTQKNAISSPATGLVVYDTTLNKLSVYTGAAWETVTSL